MNEQQNRSIQPLNNNTLTLAEIIPSCFDIISSIISTCQICNQRFNKKSHLYRHVREKHEQLRSYICSYPDCGKKFKRDSHLKRHYISHTHQKNFKCGKCVMQFGYKHHLQRHIRLIHEKVLYKCTQCQAQFIKKKSLSKHVKEHDERKNRKLAKKMRRIKKSEKTGPRQSAKEEFSQQENQIIQNGINQVGVDQLSDQPILQSNEQEGINQQFYEEKDKSKDIEEKSFQKRINNGPINKSQDKLIEQNSHSEIQQAQGMEKKKSQRKSKSGQIVLFRCRYGQCLNAYKTMRSLRQHIQKKHKEEFDRVI